MEFTEDDLREAKRQIDSILHKLRETVKTLESKEHAERYRSQVTLARRRIKAFEIANRLIEEKRQAVPDLDEGLCLLMCGVPFWDYSKTALVFCKNSCHLF